ncbi:hypothetical protein Pelo_11665 [Pelomyxa schiedti]|nr:hypothetical protein Pelo_11665 [Pelomyxa schiedti]
MNIQPSRRLYVCALKALHQSPSLEVTNSCYSTLLSVINQQSYEESAELDPPAKDAVRTYNALTCLKILTNCTTIPIISSRAFIPRVVYGPNEALREQLFDAIFTVFQHAEDVIHLDMMQCIVRQVCSIYVQRKQLDGLKKMTRMVTAKFWKLKKLSSRMNLAEAFCWSLDTEQRPIFLDDLLSYNLPFRHLGQKYRRLSMSWEKLSTFFENLSALKSDDELDIEDIQSHLYLSCQLVVHLSESPKQLDSQSQAQRSIGEHLSIIEKKIPKKLHCEFPPRVAILLPLVRQIVQS